MGRASPIVSYLMPDYYHNCFYLANASLFQIINYFACKAYETVFPELVNDLQSANSALDLGEAKTKIYENIKRLEYCETFLDLNMPIKRKIGKFEIVRGMRAYHGTFLKDFTIGGLRFCGDLNRHSVQGLSILSTYRFACLGVDISGSHGGLKLCPESYEPEDLKTIVQSYVKHLMHNHGVRDIIEPDIYCNSENINNIQEILAGGPVRALDVGATLAGARAAIKVLKEFLEKGFGEKAGLDKSLKDKSFIIQGLGKLGSEMALMLCDLGATCVGVMEYDSIIYDSGGICVQELLKHIKKYGSMLNFSGKVKEHDRDKLFGEECDILVLAAVDKALSCYNADKLKAKIIVEACNGPIMPTADKILLGKGKLIVPSIIAGSGNSLMTYLEHKNRFEESNIDINAVFDSTLEQSVSEITNISEQYCLKMDLRRAAYVKAIRNIFSRILEGDLVRQNDQQVVNMHQ